MPLQPDGNLMAGLAEPGLPETALGTLRKATLQALPSAATQTPSAWESIHPELSSDSRGQEQAEPAAARQGRARSWKSSSCCGEPGTQGCWKPSLPGKRKPVPGQLLEQPRKTGHECQAPGPEPRRALTQWLCTGPQISPNPPVISIFL